jgi:hypothetical protein
MEPQLERASQEGRPQPDSSAAKTTGIDSWTIFLITW